jgi:hypothetical protein
MPAILTGRTGLGEIDRPTSIALPEVPLNFDGAEPCGISIAEDALRQVQGKLDTNFVDTGEQSLKNIARPVRVYRLDLMPKATTAPKAPRSLLAPPDKPSIAVLAFQQHERRSRAGIFFRWYRRRYHHRSFEAARPFILVLPQPHTKPQRL